MFSVYREIDDVDFRYFLRENLWLVHSSARIGFIFHADIKDGFYTLSFRAFLVSLMREKYLLYKYNHRCIMV